MCEQLHLDCRIGIMHKFIIILLVLQVLSKCQGFTSLTSFPPWTLGIHYQQPYAIQDLHGRDDSEYGYLSNPIGGWYMRVRYQYPINNAGEYHAVEKKPFKPLQGVYEFPKGHYDSRSYSYSSTPYYGYSVMTAKEKGSNRKLSSVWASDPYATYKYESFLNFRNNKNHR